MGKDSYILYGPFTQLATMSGLSLKGPIPDRDLPVIEQAGVLVSQGRITAVDAYQTLKESYKDDAVREVKFPAGFVALPGFIDAHSHICYAGSRARDYAARNAGMSYLEIAKAGGGIWDTVQKTRTAKREDLIQVTLDRAFEHLRLGTTTLEVKSGYGLNIESEIKMLQAISEVNENIPIDLISTCLAAHTLPKDRSITTGEYLQELTQHLLPELLEQQLTNRVDIFVEEGAFNVRESISFLEQAIGLGYSCTVHADQFSTGGSEVAVTVGALSADHLEASGKKEIELLAKSNVMPVALPGASLGLGCGLTPARKLLDAGTGLAIASDHNPGSAPMGRLITQASILGTYEKLSQAEVFAGITVRAAAALGLNDRGSLETGKIADLVVYKLPDINEILYHQGSIDPSVVIKNGGIAFSHEERIQ